MNPKLLIIVVVKHNPILANDLDARKFWDIERIFLRMTDAFLRNDLPLEQRASHLTRIYCHVGPGVSLFMGRLAWFPYDWIKNDIQGHYILLDA